MLLVVEDDALCRRALDRLLGGRARTHASNAEEARAALSTIRGLTGCLLDVALPEGPRAGLELLASIRAAYTTVPCALLTGTCEPSLVNAAELLRARTIIKPATAELLRWILDQSDLASPAALVRHTAKSAQERYQLTDREAEIVACFLSGRDIADFLADTGLSRSTFKSHRRSILAKTATRSLEELAAHLHIRAFRRDAR